MRRLSDYSIWGFAFGYFASYVPYAALTKAVTSGALASQHGVAIPGVELLPLSVGASLVGMFAFITAMRWWKHATQFKVGGLSLPRPTLWTFMSGVCTSGIIATTTLAYTFHGISIVFMVLLMKGGVLIIAPMVDEISGRKVRWYSTVGLILSVDALIVTFLEPSGGHGFALTAAALIDVAVYLAAYFIRLQFMTRLAKSDDADKRTRYFVEEQMVATPVLMLFLAVSALLNFDAFTHSVRLGFTSMWHSPVLVQIILIGLFSQGTGIFGGLVLLDKRENTYSVPVNRCSSILAGVAASFVNMLWLGRARPSSYELVGAAFIIQAILFLTVPLLLAKRSTARS